MFRRPNGQTSIVTHGGELGRRTKNDIQVSGVDNGTGQWCHWES